MVLLLQYHGITKSLQYEQIALNIVMQNPKTYIAILIRKVNGLHFAFGCNSNKTSFNVYLSTQKSYFSEKNKL